MNYSLEGPVVEELALLELLDPAFLDPLERQADIYLFIRGSWPAPVGPVSAQAKASGEPGV